MRQRFAFELFARKAEANAATAKEFDQRVAESQLLPLQNFVDRGLAAFVDADDFVHRLETGQRDIHDVVPRSPA